ncbi:DUF7521 family protein [Halorarum salinum]|uniref:Uncharacterized protein n=1 Tax=Halorarum salinum TaxID=2743089 RepID=A0A7D5QF89_9EURY|nr:hypothetical protein [Halobaculum salinum]QLG60484.1 hypothetical protein HUG12_01440 [Halobaculum salinum]
MSTLPPISVGAVTLPFQIEVTGGSAPTVAAVFALLAVTMALSLLITVRLVRGYARTSARPLLLLAVGLFLLTAAPTIVQLGFLNALAAPSAHRMVLVTTAKLAGLLTILYTIHQ